MKLYSRTIFWQSVKSAASPTLYVLLLEEKHQEMLSRKCSRGLVAYTTRQVPSLYQFHVAGSESQQNLQVEGMKNTCFLQYVGA